MERVISNPDIPIIYELPLSFEKQGLGDILVDHFNFEVREPKTEEWRGIVDKFQNANDTVTVAMPGKYTTLSDSYKSINESLAHAAAECGVRVEVKWIETEERCDIDCLQEDLTDVDGVLLTPGFGSRGVDGMVNAATITIESKIPFLGICYGAQLGTVAFARRVMGWDGAHTTEVDEKSLYPVVDLMDEQKQMEDKGGTMRLGGHDIRIVEGTVLYKLYETETVRERFRHRYHLIDRYVGRMKEHGLIISAYDGVGKIINAIEIEDHPFWIGVQFHPEFKSRPGNPHPLYMGLIRAAIDYKKRRENQ